MFAEGSTDAPLLLVLTHKPSEGMENWLYKSLYDQCKIVPTDCRFVYMLNEAPRGSSGKHTVEQLRESWNRFTREIGESSPKAILAFGSDVLYYLTGIRESIHDSRGYVLTKKYFRDIEWKVRGVIGAYKTNNKNKGIKIGDPRYGMVTEGHRCVVSNYDGVIISTFGLDHIRTSEFSVVPAFKQDILRASRAIKNELYMIDENFTYISNVADLHSDVWTSDIIAVDIETRGINNDVIERVSLSNGRFTCSIPWDDRALDFLNEVIFSQKDTLFALHNSGFDLPRLKAHGVNITQEILDYRIFDTMFAAVTLQPDLLKGLGPAASVYLDVEPWKWRTLSEANPIYYSAKDAFVTYWLAKQEISVLKNMGLWNLVMGTGNNPGPGVMATIPVLTDLKDCGIKVDRTYAQWWVDKLERRHLRLLKLWTRMFGGISPASPKQLQELFYTEWGLPVQTTKKDNITTDVLSLVKLKYYIKSDYAMLHDTGAWKTDKRCNPRTFDLLLAIRDVAKTISTYVEPVSFNEEMRVHPSYLPESKDNESGPANSMRSKGNTATGRLATYHPNIGNQPKKVRRLYIPDSSEHCFIQADWKAAELQVFAWTAGDKRLIDDLGSGDLHKRNALRYGITRDVAKNVIYASQYLAGPSKVNEMILAQEHIYVPVEECRRIMKGFEDYYHDVTALKRHIISLCENKKYVQNPFGRVRLFHSGEAPAAVDFWAQSIVADCLWCVLKSISDMAKSLDGRLITTVYDSVVIQVVNSQVETACERLKEIMERKFDIVCPGFYIPCELEIGEPGASWGELKK